MAVQKGMKTGWKTKCRSTWREMYKYRWLYFLLIPGIVFFLLFKYVPMYGLRIAFMDYNQYNPAASAWVGLDQFIKLFSKRSFLPVLRNTVVIEKGIFDSDSGKYFLLTVKPSYSQRVRDRRPYGEPGKLIIICLRPPSSFTLRTRSSLSGPGENGSLSPRTRMPVVWK